LNEVTSMKSVDTKPTVVVGVSGSEAGRAALRYAVHEAAARHCQVRLLRVWRDVGWFPSMTRADVLEMPNWERADKAVLTKAAAAARRLDPDADVLSEWVAGDLYSTLEQAAQEAVLLVVGAGSRDDDGCGIAQWLQRHVACEVAVVDSSGASGLPSQPTNRHIAASR
jgi:nucleotide-binding universal stress UspA family protein